MGDDERDAGIGGDERGAGMGDGVVVRGASGGGLLAVVGGDDERSERLHVEQRNRLMSLGVLQYGQIICGVVMN